MKMAGKKEMVLYYEPDSQKGGGNTGKSAKLKGVLVRMGVRIKNVAPEQTGQTVGFLAGMEGFAERQTGNPVIEEEVLVMKNFTSGRIDQLLMGLRQAGVPRIHLKAVITDTNSSWSFYQLYEELKKEHKAMSGNDRG